MAKKTYDPEVLKLAELAANLPTEDQIALRKWIDDVVRECNRQRLDAAVRLRHPDGDELDERRN